MKQEASLFPSRTLKRTQMRLPDTQLPGCLYRDQDSCRAINVDIPEVSNALSRLLLDTPELIRRADATSRQRGEQLAALLRKQADVAGVEVATTAVTVPIAALAEVAATKARYFDLSVVG